MKNRILLLIFALGISFLTLTSSVGAVGTEKIDSFESEIHINKDNQAEISEVIAYDFGLTQHHGIYRDVPIDYKDPQGNVYRLAMEHTKTTDENGKEVKASVSKSDGNFRIRLGEADKYVTGKHTYKIKYKLWPIVTQKDQKGFLALDVTGNGWSVPILHASAVVRLDGASLEKPACFTGVVGSTEQNCVIDGQKFTADNLKAGEGFSIEGYVAGGYIAKYLQPNQKRPLTKSDIGIIAGFVFAILVGLVISVILLARSLRKRRRRKDQTVVAEYEPPSNLSVAEIGHLEDDTSSVQEITAMIISMAVKGYLKIQQTQKKSFLKKAKYTLLKLKESKGLDTSEDMLFNALFSTAKDNKIQIDNLSKSTMSTTIYKIHSNTKKSLESKGFYASIASEPNILEKMLDAGNITDEGAKIWAKVDGFKLYLSVVEKERMKFHDAPERTPELFSKYLPFAVALGVEKEWAKQFEGIDIAKATNWYAGSYAGFSAMNLANDLGNSFAPVVSSNSTVSSSGGGGSSGGGFGGGGGGSW
ncbi:MAG: DUF2207 domain-containing protein [Patescibacteria group bacterium]